MIYVHFANTAGDIFTADMPDVGPHDLGTMLRGDSVIVFVDREPYDAISRIETSVLVSSLSDMLDDNGAENRRPRYVCESNDKNSNLFTQKSVKPSKLEDTAALSRNKPSVPSVTIYMPRMAHDMYGEAVIQREFYRNIPNIVIETV